MCQIDQKTSQWIGQRWQSHNGAGPWCRFVDIVIIQAAPVEEKWKDGTRFESKATLHLPKLITRAWRLDRANQIQVSNSRKVQVRALGRGALTREIFGYPKQCIASAIPTCSRVDWKFCKIPMKTTKASDLLNKVKTFEEADQMLHRLELRRSGDDARQLRGRQTHLRLQSELVFFSSRNSTQTTVMVTWTMDRVDRDQTFSTRCYISMMLNCSS